MAAMRRSCCSSTGSILARFSKEIWGDFLEVTAINKLQNNGTGMHWRCHRMLEWYDQTSFEKDWAAHRTGPPQASNYLVNGRNIKPDGSAGQRMQFKFTPGKKHLMRFVNIGLDQLFKVKIDGHSLLVIANDNVPIVPYSTKEVSIGIGQRYHVVVTADQAVANYFLRTIPAPACSFNKNTGLGSANAVISYSSAGSSLPTTTNTLVDPQCFDESITNLVPIVTVPVDGSTFAAQFATLPVNLREATPATGENVFIWYLNGISQNIDWSKPTISAVALNRTIANAANTSAYLPTNGTPSPFPNQTSGPSGSFRTSSSCPTECTCTATISPS